MYLLGAVRAGIPFIRCHTESDKTSRQAVPVIKCHAGAQRVGACSTLLALLRLHVKELPLTTGES